MRHFIFHEASSFNATPLLAQLPGAVPLLLIVVGIDGTKLGEGSSEGTRREMSLRKIGTTYRLPCSYTLAFLSPSMKCLVVEQVGYMPIDRRKKRVEGFLCYRGEEGGKRE